MLDLSYKPPGEPADTDVPWNTTRQGDSSSSNNRGGGGRSGRNSGEDCIDCTTTSLYLTSIYENDDECHLIPLFIKVAEGDSVEEADEDKISPRHPAIENISSSVHSQGSKQPFPVNILLDTGSLGPDGNYIHKDIASIIDPLKINTKRSTLEICSGMDGSCVAQNSYLFVTVMLTKLLFITIVEK
jgi:hypothetical protein